ncbi:hypothetical protein HUJ04_000810 [Dendroctonus ponderosae]|nr:hypothetical protein HUJ04_000810 [Dendroctonus ponderosae]KAH1018672.1 hypothetical protein HUJ05_006398 [Dendroctonus ponderosae]
MVAMRCSMDKHKAEEVEAELFLKFSFLLMQIFSVENQAPSVQIIFLMLKTSVLYAIVSQRQIQKN